MTFESVRFLYARRILSAGRAGRMVSWLLLFAIGIVLIGCTERDDTEDKVVATLAVSELERISERHHLPTEYQERAKAALSELRSRGVNTTPMFIYAILTPGDGPTGNDLRFMCFDEGRDLRGIRIREQRKDEMGTVHAVEENYPIFVDFLESWTVERRVIPVAIRDAGQRKDEKLWLEYENRRLNALVQEIVATKRKHSGSPALVEKMSVREIPPLYVSLPDPNRMDVQIRAYDKTGHESEWIEVQVGPGYEGAGS